MFKGDLGIRTRSVGGVTASRINEMLPALALDTKYLLSDCVLV